MRTFVVPTFLAAAITAAITLSAPSALADDTWTTVNPNTDGSYTGLLASGTTAAFSDSPTGAHYICTSSSVLGTAPRSGTGLPNPMSIASIAYSSCSGPLASTASGGLAGPFNAETYEPIGGTTIGSMTGSNASLTINNILGSCNVRMNGDVAVTYANDGTLTTSASPLRVTAADGTGCAGQINAGDTMTYGATYDVIPILTITSP